MEGSIEINGLRLFGRHGVYEEELLNGNTFELTLLLDYDISRPMISDDINDTLNYAQAVEIIRKEMETPSKLLEHVASHTSGVNHRISRNQRGLHKNRQAKSTDSG